MIEITVDPKVLTALSAAFPTPPNAAQRALDKYVTTLRNLTMASLSRGQSTFEVKLNLLSLSLHDLANKGGQIGPKKVRVHAWLRDNNLALIQQVEVGSNLTGLVSQVKFTGLVTLDWHEPEAVNDSICVDGVDIDRALLKQNASRNAELFRTILYDYDDAVREGTVQMEFDTVDIDTVSLGNYIQWLRDESTQFSDEKRNHQLFQARIILAIAQHKNGKYPQRKQPSEFGRTYYRGTSVQNVHKQLRRAMLGHSWEYDIRSSVVAWKMGFAKDWVESYCPNLTVEHCFVNSLSYLEQKKTFLNHVRLRVFGKDCDHAEEFQLKLLKQAFTALSFGAQLAQASWQNRKGQWVTTAIAEILKIKEERERFIADADVRGFIAEQSELDDYLFDGVKAGYSKLLNCSCVQTASGQPSKAKVIAYLYQHGETKVMNVVRDAMAEFNKTVLGNIHDAIIIRERLTIDDRHEIEYRMREQTGNPYWRLGATELEPWAASQKEALKEEAAHRQRMKVFEVEAKKRLEILIEQSALRGL